MIDNNKQQQQQQQQQTIAAMKIHSSVIKKAIALTVRVRRDHMGYYHIVNANGTAIYSSMNPTAKSALLMLKRYI